MKDIIFPLIPRESVWIYWLGHHKPAKLSTFPHPIMLKNEEKSFSTLFSKCCHSITDKDFSMQPTENGDKFPKFSLREIGFNLSRNFDDFPEILVQSSKAVLVEAFQCAKKHPSLIDLKKN